MTIDRGSTLDRYELLCHLARGGMADVWLARLHSKPDFERLFAIKTVLPGEAGSPVFRTMFLDEARLVSRIDHPNVVRVTDVGEHEGLPYLVMELIEGDSLDKLMLDLRRAGGTLPLGIALRITTDACNGLAAAHELCDTRGAPLDVVHRDVSPQNILVTTSGISKVIDFGIAKGRDRATAKTSTGVLKGKACYMPTEQACGEEVDARTDTWALGAVLYYLLAGRAPYKSDSELATLKKAITAAPIPPLPSHVPGPVRALVDKALSHDPAARFQSAGELAAGLEEVTRELGVAVSAGEVRSFVRRAMAARLAARRELVSQALADSASRLSTGLLAAVPIEVDVDVDVDVEASGATGFGAVRSSAQSIVRELRLPRSRLGLAGAALLFGVLGLVGFAGRAHAPAAGAGVVAPPAMPPVARLDPVPVTTVEAPAQETTPAVSASAAPPRPRVAAPPRTAGPVAAPKTPSAATRKSRDDEAGF